ncbi:HNH endonuclease [Leucobacter sp. NPDC058333]|uniref:HNH endonuclease n=1 Tax=Leucobacter sp. NPDC058333 TaxID=3346450 RepID=UPI003653CB7D
MPWETSNRRDRLPKDWPQIRAAILERDGHRCQQCGRHGTHVDHIDPGDDHRPSNLQTLCAPCHWRKSRAEGGRAVHKGRRVVKRIPRLRPAEQHPGLG